MLVLGPRLHCGFGDLKREVKVAHCHALSSQEPLWTNLELEIFWHVLHEHIDNLLMGVTSCPDPDIDFSDLDPKSSYDYDRCLHRVQELTWCGRYSMAVANFRAARRHFRDIQSQRYADCQRACELEFLRLLFMRRMPRRCEL